MSDEEENEVLDRLYQALNSRKSANFTKPNPTWNFNDLEKKKITLEEIMEYLKVQSCLMRDIYDKIKAIEEKLDG